jgi:hypothetical protein
MSYNENSENNPLNEESKDKKLSRRDALKKFAKIALSGGAVFSLISSACYSDYSDYKAWYYAYYYYRKG